jgi:hypothetical protein
VLPDCEGRSLDGMDTCYGYDNHPGGHSFELHDPRLEQARATALAMLTHWPSDR